MLQSISVVIHLKAELTIKAETQWLFSTSCEYKGMKCDFYALDISPQVKTFTEIVFVFVFILIAHQVWTCIVMPMFLFQFGSCHYCDS